MARPVGSNGRQTAERARAAATRLFARRGYAAVSMRDIADEVGIGAGALYNHFTTKQDMLVGMMQAHLKALLCAFDEAAASGPRDPSGRLDAFTRFHIRFHRERADAVFVSYMELRSLEAENFAEIESLRAAYEGRLTSILEDGANAGVFDAPEPKIAAMAIIAMLTGVTQWYRQGGRLSADAIENLYIDMVARSVRPIRGS